MRPYPSSFFFLCPISIVVLHWENNNIQPSIDMLVKIARFFSVSTDYLLCLDDRQLLDTSGLSPQVIAHLQQLIDDIRTPR